MSVTKVSCWSLSMLIIDFANIFSITVAFICEIVIGGFILGHIAWEYIRINKLCSRPVGLVMKNVEIIIFLYIFQWAQVEWWLEHRHCWLVKRQWAGSVLGRVTRVEYQVLGSTSIPARLDILVYWESFSWLTKVGTTRNTVLRLGWSRIRLAMLILHAVVQVL